MSKVLIWGLIVVLALVSVAACASPTPAAPTKTAAVAPAPTTAATAPTVAVAATKPAAAAATAAPTAAPVAKIKRGGTLREANTATYPTLDPQLSSAFTQAGHRMIFDAMFRYELVDEKVGTHEVKGELVESWQMVDPSTFTFKLRPGVKFHDGSDWNAQGAKFNLDRLLDNKKSTAKTYVEAIKSVDVVDPMTIKINLKTPSAALLVNLSGVVGPVSMVSQKAVEGMGEDAFNNKPVGSGPFEVVEWLRDNRVNTKKFTGYWRKGEDGQPLPYLDGAVFRQIGDPSVMLMEMKAGTLDVFGEPEAKDVAGLKSSADLVYYQHPSAINGRSMGLNQKQGPFANNLKFRQALMYAIDRDAMNKTLAFGIGQPYKWVYWAPGHAGYDTSLPFYSFDPAKSKQLLTEAAVPAGTEITISVIGRPLDQRIGEMVKQMLDTAGIPSKMEVMERLAWIDKLKNYNFDFAFWGGLIGADADQNTRNLATGAAGNWSSWTDPRMDKCLEDGRSTYDAKQRDEVYKRCQKLIYDEAYVGGMYYWPYSIAHVKSLKNVKSQWTMMDLREVWIDK